MAHAVLDEPKHHMGLPLSHGTLALGCVFLVIKGFEYEAKFSHGILPGRIHEKLDGDNGRRYAEHVKEQLKHIVAGAKGMPNWESFQTFVETKQKEANQYKSEKEAELNKAKAKTEAAVAKADEKDRAK